MAASGLNPRDQGRTVGFLLDSLVDFALSMMDALQDVNKHSFNSFQCPIEFVNIFRKTKDQNLNIQIKIENFSLISK